MGEMSNWAKKEISLANKENDENKYYTSCCDSAYKAFQLLLKDGHSGMSIGITKYILNRLIDGRPLTPIEDVNDVWSDTMYKRKDGTKIYQCKRMNSLFKNVTKDGITTYNDVSRCVGYTRNNKDSYFHSGLIDRIVDEIYPITMPYNPTSESIKVCCDELLTNNKNGDYDTIAIRFMTMPDGRNISINRYFKELNDEMVEISKKEYICRLAMDYIRRKYIR